MSLDKYTLDPGANVNFMTKQGTLSGVPLLKLIEVLGPPSSAGWCEKVQYEWILTGPNGVVILIYDWNGTPSPDNWCIGSLKSSHAQDFIKWLNKKIQNSPSMKSS